MIFPDRIQRKIKQFKAAFVSVSRSEYRPTLYQELRHFSPFALRSLPWLFRSVSGITLADIVEQHAQSHPDELALEMGNERWTWADLHTQISKIARFLFEKNVRAGDRIALWGPNSLSYVAWVLGISRVGATAALINTHLRGIPLKRALEKASPKIVVAHTDFAIHLDEEMSLRVLRYGEISEDSENKCAQQHRSLSNIPFSREHIKRNDDFVYIYTSGTTGFPKLCRISHSRAIMSGVGFGRLVFEFKPGDKLYNVLPLYHGSALLIGLSSCIVTRTPMALRRDFSAQAFWGDVHRYQATSFLYIGELCRYLLNTPQSQEELKNPLRIAVGNGLRADLWEPFQKRFGISSVREFYGATEAPGLIVNLWGNVGSVGRIPFRSLSPFALVRYDAEGETHPTNADGFLQQCNTHETGELLIKIHKRTFFQALSYRGYLDSNASNAKIIHNVFRHGDAYFRTGDLLRYDENDFFYFVDRIGNTFRWKGENVSTLEVEDVLMRVPFVAQANVVGVEIPGQEGRAGLAALLLHDNMSFDLKQLSSAAQELPDYARPRFLRFPSQLTMTTTHKLQKETLRKEGVNPSNVNDPLFVLLEGTYTPLTHALWRDIVEGKQRL